MKKAFFLITTLLIGFVSFSQLVQASLGLGSQPNRVKIYLKSAVSQSPANISTLQFNVAISTTVTPKPNMTVVSTAFPGVTWVVNEATEAGFYNYMITTSTSPITFNIAANTDFEALEVAFTNGPPSPNNVLLATLPDGGTGPTNGNALFLATGSLQSDGSNLYYTRAGIIVDNQFSYDETNLSSGTSVSTATVGNIVLPINWLSFSAVRQSADVAINWSVANEQNTDRYDIEMSTNGMDFITLFTTKKSAGLGTKHYHHLDQQVARHNSKILYYRIKHYEQDGKYSYSPVRSVRLDVKGEISVFPVPAKDGFTLTIPYLNPNQERIRLQLVNHLGQVADQKEITRLAAVNYYYNLQSSFITSGDYMLRIFENGQLTETKRVLIKK